jgi:urea-proton symporter
MAEQLLSQATGYGIICGLSVVFCIIILVAVRLQKRYLSEDSDQSEMVRYDSEGQASSTAFR